MIAVELKKPKTTLKDDVVKDTQSSIKRLFTLLGKILPERLKEAFRGPAKQQGRPGLPEWVETSRIAKIKRKLFPRAGRGDQRGEKGFTQRQAQYLYAAPTLVDTGAGRDSIEVTDMRTDRGPFLLVLGPKKDYMRKHVKGGTVTLPTGESIKLPKRDWALLTDDDQTVIDEATKEVFS